MKILLLIFGVLSCSAAVAQQPPLEPVKLSDFANAKPGRCEYRTAILDGIHQKTPADETITVIARLGDGETRTNLSWRRLHNVRVYWTQYLYKEHRRKPETIILAEGERVKGLGHLEFYVGGKLVEVMKVARTADLSIGSCYPPDDSYIRNRIFNPCWLESNRNFYPCRDKRMPGRNWR
ncbi:MAG: hypothetical protein LC795_01520 [Acidobacteria bacterium]|nr:hypothetical protein [Acidobacteriota bacterium]